MTRKRSFHRGVFDLTLAGTGLALGSGIVGQIPTGSERVSSTVQRSFGVAAIGTNIMAGKIVLDELRDFERTARRKR